MEMSIDAPSLYLLSDFLLPSRRIPLSSALSWPLNCLPFLRDSFVALFHLTVPLSPSFPICFPSSATPTHSHPTCAHSICRRAHFRSSPLHTSLDASQTDCIASHTRCLRPKAYLTRNSTDTRAHYSRSGDTPRWDIHSVC